MFFRKLFYIETVDVEALEAETSGQKCHVQNFHGVKDDGARRDSIVDQKVKLFDCERQLLRCLQQVELIERPSFVYSIVTTQDVRSL